MAIAQSTIDYYLGRGVVHTISTSQIFAAGSGAKNVSQIAMPFVGHVLQAVATQICLLGSFDLTLLSLALATSTTPTYTNFSAVINPADTEGVTTNTLVVTNPETEYAVGDCLVCRATMAATITLEMGVSWLLVPSLHWNNPN